MHQTATLTCDKCGAPLAHGQLVCRTCGALIHSRRLNEIAAEALRQEPINPSAAAMTWRQALDLLPPDSQQYAMVYQRMGALASGWSAPALHADPRLDHRADVRPPDPWPLASAKTIGSMAISIAAYAYLFQSLTIAVGFVVLMLVHEMGHVFAMRYYGLSASPPIFIPFIGALINLRQSPPNALVESVVGIGGPLLGTIGALVCYAICFTTHGQMRHDLLIVTELALFLNLFNLLPIPPLDGGRVTAAISPWLWLLGLVALFAFMFLEARTNSLFSLLIPVLILMSALPRIRMTLRARGMHVPYYNVSRTASWIMGCLYIGLGAVLTLAFLHIGGMEFLRKMLGA